MTIHAIINHESRKGNGRCIEEVLCGELGEALIDVSETEYQRHATELARQAAERHIDSVVVVGGDGTVNEVVNGLVGTNVTLGVIPAGTANDLASLYGLPSDPRRACRNVLQPRVELLDVLQVNGWHFITGGGVGLPCDVARIADSLKRHHGLVKMVGWLLGSKVYLLALLIALVRRTKDSNPAVIQYDDTVIAGDFLWMMVENQPIIGKRFILSPGAENTDGLLDICLVDNHKTKAEILSLSMKVTKGDHVSLPSVTVARSHEMVMTFEKPVAFFGDGETGPVGKEFHIKVLPQSLMFITGHALDGQHSDELVASDFTSDSPRRERS